MKKEETIPKSLCALYRDREITRKQFVNAFGKWQKENGKDVLESEVVRQVKQVIAKTGLQVQRINTGAFTVGEGAKKRFVKTARAGTLDFEGYDNRGRFVGIECKRPKGGRLSAAQRERVDDINAKGGVAIVVTSGEQALRELKERGCVEA